MCARSEKHQVLLELRVRSRSQTQVLCKSRVHFFASEPPAQPLYPDPLKGKHGT